MDAFNFDEIAAANLTGKTCDADSFFRIACTGGIGQQGNTLRNVVQNVVNAAKGSTAQGKGNNLCACMLYRCLDEVKRILAGAQDKAGSKFMSAEFKCISHGKNLLFASNLK